MDTWFVISCAIWSLPSLTTRYQNSFWRRVAHRELNRRCKNETGLIIKICLCKWIYMSLKWFKTHRERWRHPFATNWLQTSRGTTLCIYLALIMGRPVYLRLKLSRVYQQLNVLFSFLWFTHIFAWPLKFLKEITSVQRRVRKDRILFYWIVSTALGGKQSWKLDQEHYIAIRSVRSQDDI